MLCLTDVQDFERNNYNYFDQDLVNHQAPGLEYYPKQGKFTIGSKTVNLYLYDNPWAYSYSKSWQNTQAINSVFQYCVVCGSKNFQDNAFEDLGMANPINLKLLNCDKYECRKTILELIDGKYIKLLKAILNKKAVKLRRYTDPSGDPL